ncbi:ribonuclease HI [Thiosulfatimonas sediminis]|uniref:Ribonuclease HI n=1 Tax=Thiosulfatimonas sediminis TaxID=2675054 RepID=A0A6F8PVB9_9GAMM|nr:RNase H family protein [Thiosulfatimonas sediminis]BBP46083.1 ribonuclease HI [Thiosulfatimonas sediminis]
MDFRQHTPYRLHTQTECRNPCGAIQVFSDGAYFKQYHLGGWGVAIYQNERLVKTLKGIQTSHSSLEMELVAAIQALTWLQRHYPKHTIALYTDAQILLEGLFSKYANWQTQHWKSRNGNPVAYATHWQQLYQLVAAQSVDIFWIKAHAKHPQNELVDHLARAQILQAQDDSVQVPPSNDS